MFRYRKLPNVLKLVILNHFSLCKTLLYLSLEVMMALLEVLATLNYITRLIVVFLKVIWFQVTTLVNYIMIFILAKIRR